MLQAAFFLYLWPVKRTTLVCLTLYLSLLPVLAQSPIIGDSLKMRMAEECLRLCYAHEFTEAKSLLGKIKTDNPGHPAPPFLEALILYWEHFPLQPGMIQSEAFVALMDLSIERAAPMLEATDTHVEGSFFDLFGRAFKAMYWADNGKTAKAAGDLRIMYQRTREGFDLVDDFSDFLFSTGLYNYYIEAYPEAHPIFKPLVAFMHKGDRQKGLELLGRAMEECIYLKVEARLFMTLIQVNYENDLDQAAIYARELLEDFPKNMYYQGLALTIFLHQQRYEEVRALSESMSSQSDPYSLMLKDVARAFLAEHEGRAQDARLGNYHAIGKAELIGPLADTFRAMAYMGLSRLSGMEGNESEARKYQRKASSCTSYHFILEASW